MILYQCTTNHPTRSRRYKFTIRCSLLGIDTQILNILSENIDDNTMPI